MRERAVTSLDLAFLVDHVFAHDRIVLLELELFRGVLLVLLRGVEVAVPAEEIMRILSWDLLAMIRSSDLFAAGAHVGNHGFDAILVDGAQGVVGHTQLDPAVFAGNPEATLMQVRQPAATGTVVGVRDVVAAHHTLAGDLTYTGHDDLRKNGLLKAVITTR